MFPPVFPPAVDHHIPSASAAFFGSGFDPWVTETHENNPFFYPTTQEPSTPKTNTSNSGSDDGAPTKLNPIDERKRRRMISNRESARRSRMRKQKHLENLSGLVNRHKSGNRELTDRLRFVIRQEQILRQENQRLKTESGILRQRLWDLHQVMLVWQIPNQLLSSAWPCNNNVTPLNEQNPPSLIT
ncbi:hypothetical protein SSX86_002835 [Deinandra increscens subsp. villosa]|uniref:BZIP domain-containing protein n=1 Tax=Deinandra increscens subsp. villosa TaxID=3103831 RepID=A0AAP0HBP3_9ASTR